MKNTNLERHTVHRNKNFATINTVALNDTSLSVGAQWLHVKIFILPPEWQFSVKGLSKLTGVSVYKIKSALKELEEHGYLIRSRLRDEETGQYIINEFGVGTKYDFYEEPVDVATMNTTTNGIDPRQIIKDQIRAEETKTEKKQKKERKQADYDEEFEKAWEAYGKIGSKLDAENAYKKARKTASREEIFEGIGAYKRQQEIRHTEKQYVKNFSTWLNKKCWADEYESTARTKQKNNTKTKPNVSSQSKNEKDYNYNFGNKKSYDDVLTLDGLWI